MPVLSGQKLEMADIDDIHALMLSQQATTHLRTHLIRQKTAFLEQNPVHAILGDMLYSCFWLLRAVFQSLNDPGLSLSYLLLRAKIYAVI